jgi:hypothetical protein
VIQQELNMERLNMRDNDVHSTSMNVEENNELFFQLGKCSKHNSTSMHNKIRHGRRELVERQPQYWRRKILASSGSAVVEIRIFETPRRQL